MKLKVLVDNNTYIDQYYCGEPAVSYYMEDGGVKILFDTGYSDLFIKNAMKLNINLDDLDCIVISHGHNDHTGGLVHYLEKYKNNKISIIGHPDAFKEKILNSEKISVDISLDEIQSKCNLIFSKKSKKISDNIYFLGEIPRVSDFEGKNHIGKINNNDNYEDDYILDDSALAFKSSKGIYIITGCSHSGICNIVEHAKLVCNDDRVLGILGGLHLFEIDEQLTKTISYLEKYKLKEIYPCHCTSFSVRAEMNKSLPLKEVGVSLEIEW